MHCTIQHGTKLHALLECRPGFWLRRTQNDATGTQSQASAHTELLKTARREKRIFSPYFYVLRVTDFIQLIQRVPSFEGSGELKIDGQALRTVKYTDDFVLTGYGRNGRPTTGHD